MTRSDFKLPIPIACILILLFVPKEVLTQRLLELSTGISIPELSQTGLRYQIGQTIFGSHIGSLRGPWQRQLSATADVCYHFGRNAKLMDGSTWFVNFGLNYIHDDGKYVLEKYVYEMATWPGNP